MNRPKAHGSAQVETSPREATRSARFWSLALALTLCAASCGPDAPTTPPSERIQVRIDRERAIRRAGIPVRPPWDADRVAIVQESREAVRGTFGEPLAFPITRSGVLEVVTAFAVEIQLGDGPLGRVAHELRLRSPNRDELLAEAETGLETAAQSWRPLRAQIRVAPGEAAEIVVVARWLGDTPVPPDARALHAVPRVVAVQPDRRNVLVISIDTLRANHLGFHGYARATSPNLDALVARGTVFERAISTSPWTLPSYGTLFTGLEPTRHRVGISARREAAFGANHDDPPGDFQSLQCETPTLAEAFAAGGWVTGALVSNPFLFTSSRIDRGFDSYAGYANRAQAGVELATRWIDRRGDAPWFLLLHLMDPHSPYTPPEPYDTRFSKLSFRLVAKFPMLNEDVRAGDLTQADKDLLVDSYDGEIAYTDAQIGRLLDFLKASGALERTLVVVHSDHGEEFWEHGSFEHGHSLHDEVLHVPLAFVAPGLVADGLRIPGRTSTVDVYATLLELAGLPIPEGLDGRSRAAAMRVDRQLEAGLDPRPCISEALLYGERELKAWSNATEKLVTDGAERSQLYDIEADPHERKDLASERAARVRELRDELRRRGRSLRALFPEDDAASFGRDARGDLERLGYPGADPK